MSVNKAVVLGGKTGLLGQSLVRALEAAGWIVIPLGRADVDIFDPEALGGLLDREECGALFNAVAYTQVDKAEDEPEAAFRLNATLPRLLGGLAKPRGIRLVHYSTDFVFDGRADTPYTPESPTNPLSVYGRSKLEGERALLNLDPPGLLIIRTAWLFGPGRMNFVRRILELARTRDQLNVVHDQVGSPTYTPDLARNSVALVQAGGAGLHHLACSGRASWCELASEAVSAAGLHCAVAPITTEQYPTKARRPAYSVLDLAKFTGATGIKPRPWVQCLREYVFDDLGYPLETKTGAN